MLKCENCPIKNANSLRTLTHEELNNISNNKTVMSFKKGDILFKEGAHLSGVFCLRNGKCKVTKLSPNGKDQIIRFIKKGELVGERSVLSGSTAHLTVTALEDMEACFIPKEEIELSFKNNTNFSLDITKAICSDLDNANISIANLAQKNVKERLADTLLLFDRTFGVDDEGFLNIKLSREEIANAIGTATESCIRLLSQFKKDKLIELKGKKIKLINTVKLQHITEGY
ncbi:MAG TPA: Crp/Fnr family transcriptional regulator [Flavobacteriaceae bacterium]|nr:Crp/Fnr family transcriptional regulator [Flavobacteriaceae bacterium]